MIMVSVTNLLHQITNVWKGSWNKWVTWQFHMGSYVLCLQSLSLNRRSCNLCELANNSWIFHHLFYDTQLSPTQTITVWNLLRFACKKLFTLQIFPSLQLKTWNPIKLIKMSKGNSSSVQTFRLNDSEWANFIEERVG